MLIAVDGFESSASTRVGVGRFEVELMKSIYQYDLVNKYKIYTPRIPTSDMPESESFFYRICSFRRMWSQIALPIYLQIDRPRPDIFFAPVHYAPRFIAIPTVVGIMDLSFIYYPDLFKPTDLYKLRYWTEYSVKKAKAVIAISKSTKNDIIKTYQKDSDDIHVIYPGIIPMDSKLDSKDLDKNSILEKYKITSPYIVYVGTLQPRKNISRLIAAFKMAKAKMPREKSNLKLVVVGKKGWLYDSIFETVQKEGLENEVIFTGYIPDLHLPVIYKNAEVFSLVSLYEGFGFPVLEAMQCGVPVVASNVSSLPELVGEAGFLVDPENVQDIARGLMSALLLTKQKRADLIHNAQKQSSQFTWEKAAKQTIALFQKIGKNEG